MLTDCSKAGTYSTSIFPTRRVTDSLTHLTLQIQGGQTLLSPFVSKHFRLCRWKVPVTTTELCHFNTKVGIYNTKSNGCACVQIKLYLQTPGSKHDFQLVTFFFLLNEVNEFQQMESVFSVSSSILLWGIFFKISRL
jgi:hypothetical protein